MPPCKGMLFDIEHGSFVDGPGIRTTVFFKGCNLRCAWCHNPESQSFSREKMFFADQCIGCGACKTVCPSPDVCTLCGSCAKICPKKAISICGREYTVEEVMEEILSDLAFYQNGGGATFSGGECMLQQDFLLSLLKACKAAGIHTAVDTAGHVPWENFERILPYADLFLYDVKAMDPDLHRRYVGVDNTLILSNLRRLASQGAAILLRVPRIPGINDTEEEQSALAKLQKELGDPPMEILPYHAMGEHKYKALGRPVCYPS